MSRRLSNMLSGHQLRSVLVYPINSASSLAPVALSSWSECGENQLGGGKADVFSISMEV